MTKLNWIQSDFVPNCPIYYVLDDYKNSVLRIEYQLNRKFWYTTFFGRSGILFNGTIHESDRAKEMAESLFLKEIMNWGIKLGAYEE